MRNRYKKYLKYIEVTKSNNTLISYRKALRRFPNGTPEEIMKDPASITGAFLAEERKKSLRRKKAGQRAGAPAPEVPAEQD